jgi:hypothetical protein
MAETPERPEFVQDLESGVKGRLFRCDRCACTYVIDSVELIDGRYSVHAFDLTNGRKMQLSPRCVATTLNRATSLSVAEAKMFADYLNSQRR